MHISHYFIVFKSIELDLSSIVDVFENKIVIKCMYKQLDSILINKSC